MENVDKSQNLDYEYLGESCPSHYKIHEGITIKNGTFPFNLSTNEQTYIPNEDTGPKVHM